MTAHRRRTLRVIKPVFNELEAESVQQFVESSELVQSRFPQAEGLRVLEAGTS